MKLADLVVGNSYAAKKQYKHGHTVRAVYMGFQTSTRCEATAFGSVIRTQKEPVFAYEQEEAQVILNGIVTQREREWVVLDTKLPWIIPWADYEQILDQQELAQRDNKQRMQVVYDRANAAIAALDIKPVTALHGSHLPYIQINHDYRRLQHVDECGNRMYFYNSDATQITLSIGQLEALVKKLAKK